MSLWRFVRRRKRPVTITVHLNDVAIWRGVLYPDQKDVVIDHFGQPTAQVRVKVEST